MRFSFPLLPAEFEIPDEWWAAAGMVGFNPGGPAYLSTTAATHTIQLRQIEPPFRFPERPLDFHGFGRERMVHLLARIAAGVEIDPIPLLALPEPAEWWQSAPFQYRVRDGLHRFYASVAAGFEAVPAIVTPASTSSEA